MKTVCRSLSGRRAKGRAGGFTLIELLVVVAIISILAAIALPNFLMAQIRAKVSRAAADMRTIAVGLESYALDYNYYPPSRLNGHNLDDPLSSRTFRLTTPIAYITTLPKDIFPPMRGWNGKKDNARLQLPSFDTYDYFDARSDWDEDMKTGEGVDSTRGCQWRLASSGPDLWASFGIVWGPQRWWEDRDGLDYDATNGVVSDGDIVFLGPRIRNWTAEKAMQGY